MPKFHISVQTRYENNCGTSENSHSLSGEEYAQRVVDTINIVADPIPEQKYKENEGIYLEITMKINFFKFNFNLNILSLFTDPRIVIVKKTKPERGPLQDNWIKDLKNSNIPVMCAYKIVRAKFEVWGLQARVEAWAQKAIRDILVLAHRQAFCWTDEWYDMDYESIVEFEKETYAKTNEKVLRNHTAAHENNKKSGSSYTQDSNAFSRLTGYFSSNNDKKNVEDF